jgi:hypothetical protein
LGVLERSIEELHVGGKSALDWYKVRHYVEQNSTLHLYGSTSIKQTDWFLQRFPSDYH